MTTGLGVDDLHRPRLTRISSLVHRIGVQNQLIRSVHPTRTGGHDSRISIARLQKSSSLFIEFANRVDRTLDPRTLKLIARRRVQIESAAHAMHHARHGFGREKPSQFYVAYVHIAASLSSDWMRIYDECGGRLTGRHDWSERND